MNLNDHSTMAFLLFLLLVLQQSPSCYSLHIKVCQNKDCCSRWKHTSPFPDVLSDMLEKNGAAVTIETTSCLGQCGNGPNLSITLPRSGEMFLRGLHDATTAAAHLEALLVGEEDAVQIPSKLLAAVNVLDKAQKGTLELRWNCNDVMFVCARILSSCTCTLYMAASLESPSTVVHLFHGAICSLDQRQGVVRLYAFF